MPQVVLKPYGVFPAGQSVSAYFATQKREGAPDGASIVTTNVAADGSLTYTLAAGSYVAYALINSKHTYLSFKVDAATTTSSSSGGALFGTGVDGAVDLNGATPSMPVSSWVSRSGNVYTLTGDCHATDFTLRSGMTLNTGGFKVFATNSITIESGATVQFNGNAGAANGTAGAQNGSSSGSFGPAIIGGAGNTGAGSAGSNGASNNWANFGTGNSGAGGTGSGGAGGAAASAADTSSRRLNNPYTALTSFHGVGAVRVVSGGPSGGGGGGDGTNKGGGGGSGGGVILLSAKTVTNAGTISATGGAGGTPATGNCGGGGGGGGGVIWIMSGSAWTNTGTTAVTGGAAGAGVGTGTAGGAGGAGTVFNLIAP
jgi:hypothetical protein